MPRRRRRQGKYLPRQIRCSKCLEVKEEDGFVNDRSRAYGKFPWCKDCVRSYRQAAPKRVVGGDGERKCPVCLVGLEGTHPNRRYCSNPCKDKAKRWETFGLTPADYRALTGSGKCPICEKKVRRWEIDHNHKTGEVTGAVCRVCNGFLLAYTYHDPRIARNLASYLDSPPILALLGERRYVGPPQVSQLHRMWAWRGQDNTSTEKELDLP